MNKQQILVIHGGSIYETQEKYLNALENREPKLEWIKFNYEWKASLQNNLGDSFEALNPNMPQKDNAKYDHWKLYFEKVLDIMDKDIILVGHSLGSVFLAKFLSENIIDKNIKGLFLVAPAFNNEGMEEEPLDTFTIIDKTLQKLKDQVKNIFLYHSKDDLIVPYTHSEKFKEVLPDSKLTLLEDKFHFNDNDFPQLTEDIKSI
jgi:predicted alpha/beta hydrolase family esterase